MGNTGTTTNILLGEEPATIIIDAATTNPVSRSLDLTDPRTRARAAFAADPTKCFQHYLCEACGELEDKPKITKPIKDAQVKLIPADPEKKVAPLYDITEVATEAFGHLHRAAKSLGIDLQRMNDARNIMCDSSIRISRHRGQELGLQREPTAIEVQLCVAVAKQIVREYAELVRQGAAPK
jgi:hypothetical protein